MFAGLWAGIRAAHALLHARTLAGVQQTRRHHFICGCAEGGMLSIHLCQPRPALLGSSAAVVECWPFLPPFLWQLAEGGAAPQPAGSGLD